MKTCFKCKTKKPLEDFYTHKQMADGHLNKCKDCTKIDVKNRYLNCSDYVKDYEKKRAMLPHRVEARKEYSKSQNGKEAHNRSRKKYLAQNPDKKAAHIILNNAVRDGRILKPNSCSMCGLNSRINGHHNDYTKPLDVIWVCGKCHKLIHRNC